MKKLLLLCALGIFILASQVSAEEINYTDNVRMTNGWATIYHNIFDNTPIGFISAGLTYMQINAYQGSLVLRTAGYGITNIYLNDNYANASTYIGSSKSWHELTVLGSNGFVGIGLLQPRYKLDVNGTAHFKDNATFDSLVLLSKTKLGDCSDKTQGFGRNESGIYACLDDGNGWVRIR